MRSLLELSGEVRSCLTLACTVVGFLGGPGGSCLLVSLTMKFSWTIPSFDEEGKPSMAGPGLSATYHLVWRCFEHWWPFGVHSMTVSRAPSYGMFDPLYAISVASQGVESGWLAISSDTSGEQFGKDVKWYNITTCSSVNFVPEASTLYLVLFQQGWWQLPKLWWAHHCWLQWFWCVLGN